MLKLIKYFILLLPCSSVANTQEPVGGIKLLELKEDFLSDGRSFPGVHTFENGGRRFNWNAERVMQSDSLEAADTLQLKIIPQPVLIRHEPGQFQLPKTIVLKISKQFEFIANDFADQIIQATGRNVSIESSNSKRPTIEFAVNTFFDPVIGDEGYKLFIGRKAIAVKSNTPAGLFYGLQTLLQLFPKDIESKQVLSKDNWMLPCVSITDYPKLGWRGLMLDVARHFFDKEDVKRYIHQMAKYKYNRLHLHLTDDEAWRIEIPGYPMLTSSFSDRNTGYFTAADIKEIVAFAHKRFIEILPEIDVPGHSLAAIKAYPQLSCTPDAKSYRSYTGPTTAGGGNQPRIALVDNTLCPANERVYTFLADVFSHLATLFPFEYIHVGGDECYKNFWKGNSMIDSLMKREQIKSLTEVQAYFFRRIEKLVGDNGKKVIGWDEIVEGKLSRSTVVMNWRGIGEAVKATAMGNHIIMSPQSHAYLDFMQGDESTETNVYSSLRLRRAYDFNPVPSEVSPFYVKGGQANLWTEQVYDRRQAEYMTWPRGLAISEALWSEKKASWPHFVNKVEAHLERLELSEVKYSRAFYDPIIKSSLDADKQLVITLDTEIPGLDVYYTIDGSTPDSFSLRYQSEIRPLRYSRTFRVMTYRGGKPLGRLITISVDELRKRALKTME